MFYHVWFVCRFQLFLLFLLLLVVLDFLVHLIANFNSITFQYTWRFSGAQCALCSHRSAPYVICNFAMLNKWFFAAIVCLRWHLVLLLCTVVKCVTLCVCWVHCRKITTICSMKITFFDVKIFSHCTNGTLKVTKSTFNLETRECTFNSFRVSLAHKTVPMIYNRINIECAKYTGSCSRTMYSAT